MSALHRAAIAFVSLGILGGSSALAGEITGTGETTPLQGRSWCKYSGLNSGDAPFFEQSQSYGQLVRLGIIDGFGGPREYNPNTADEFPPEFASCNPTKTPAPRGSLGEE